ncbi:NAD(P)-dependent oxidoreductase [Endozoicomonadaceae bacterium StTr2]
MSDAPVASNRLTPEQYQQNFTDIKPALSHYQAKVEAARCLYCESAPCISACPTEINIPSFINRIATDNIQGAAETILESNILGGSCARVCPTEVLCEQACVRHHSEECKAVAIGSLQRFAIDNSALHPHPFSREATSGKSVAVVGSGPAGLACAHRLARYGHHVTIIESRNKPGGLNEYGIAAYKLVNDFAQREIDFITDIGGIDWRYETSLGQTVTLDQLRSEFDAVFLGIGLQGHRRLNIPGEDSKHIQYAVDEIARIRQSKHLSELKVGNRIIVIGGGNTAIDIACQMRRLGATDVTIAYRRSTRQMSATAHEQAFARQNGVRILEWLQPVAAETTPEGVCIQFQKTATDEQGGLKATSESFNLEADTVYVAIGQHFLPNCFANSQHPPDISHGRITVTPDNQTSLPDVWAGGDCVNKGEDLTVHAVQHGKVAAESIHRFLTASKQNNSQTD